MIWLSKIVVKDHCVWKVTVIHLITIHFPSPPKKGSWILEWHTITQQIAHWWFQGSEGIIQSRTRSSAARCHSTCRMLQRPGCLVSQKPCSDSSRSSLQLWLILCKSGSRLVEKKTTPLRPLYFRKGCQSCDLAYGIFSHSTTTTASQSCSVCSQRDWIKRRKCCTALSQPPV